MPPPGFTELPTCPICLERLDQDTSGIQSTHCDHSFHCSCVSKWTYLSCQVCRLYQQQDLKPTCAICVTLKNVWICLICGFAGCGRYEKGHAMSHSSDTQHRYSVKLETQEIWDYVGNKYVHRLNRSKADGKSIMTNSHCISSDAEYGSGAYEDDSGLDGALFSGKVEAVRRLWQQQDLKPTCAICRTLKNVWICLICGFAGCGRYEKGHAMSHSSDTQHRYSVKLETQEIWDYVGNKYVHRLNRSKADGKSIMTNSRCISSNAEYGSGAYEDDSGLDGALLSGKVEAHYESLLSEAKTNKESCIAKAVEKAVFSRMQDLQLKLASYAEEKNVVADRNKELMKNQETLQQKYKEIQHLLKDPCMPLQQTSSTELSRSPKVICISSNPTQIPFNEPGNENELINWKTYQVARHCVPILDRVIAQYPDTLKGFRAMSDILQSTLLEILAKVVDMLEQHTVGNMGMEHLENARRHLTDLKTNGIDISWLDGRLNLIHRVCNKNILVQRREELTMEVAEASAKLRHLEGKLSSIDMELEEIASRVDTHPLSTDESVIQGLL